MGVRKTQVEFVFRLGYQELTNRFMNTNQREDEILKSFVWKEVDQLLRVRAVFFHHLFTYYVTFMRWGGGILRANTDTTREGWYLTYTDRHSTRPRQLG